MTIIPAQLKTALAACLLFWGGIGIQAQTVPSTLRLAGLMNIFGKDQALLEVSPKRPSETLVLAELQMQKGVKVTHIVTVQAVSLNRLIF